MARLVPTNLGWHQHTVPCFFSLGGSARPEKLRCGFSECGHARGRVLYVVLARTSDRASVRFFLLARARQKFLDEPTHFFGGPREKTGEFSVRRTPLFWGHFQNNQGEDTDTWQCSCHSLRLLLESKTTTGTRISTSSCLWCLQSPTPSVPTCPVPWSSTSPSTSVRTRLFWSRRSLPASQVSLTE